MVEEGIIFLKNMLDDTNMRAEPNAHRRPVVLDADMSNVVASITPRVRGSSDKYVFGEYETPNRRA